MAGVLGVLPDRVRGHEQRVSRSLVIGPHHLGNRVQEHRLAVAEGNSRNGAMAVYGAMWTWHHSRVDPRRSADGMLGWRWAFYINVPIGLAVPAGSRALVEAELHRGRPDFAGALTSIGGMAALVYGITRWPLLLRPPFCCVLS
jgi:hypothetical protein